MDILCRCRNECVGIEYRMVFAIVGGGIYDGFFQFTRGDGSVCGVLYMAFTASVACMPTAKSASWTLDVMLGFAAGVMIAASFTGFARPALEMSSHLGRLACVPVVLAAGAGVLRLLTSSCRISIRMRQCPDGPPSKLPRSALLVFAITLHNIPEGLAVGVAFGAAASGAPGASIAGAMTLMFGMGLQNIPEGVAVSVPLLREGFSKNRAFFFGQLSGIVEPIAAVFGARWSWVSPNPFFPLLWLCRRGHDFCGRRRSDSRVPRLRPRRCGQPRRHHRFCGDDVP